MFIRPILLTAALATTGVLAAQPVSHTPHPTDVRDVVGLTGPRLDVTPGLPAVPDGLDPLTRYAITQGGFLLVLLIGGWSYRRDFLKKVESDRITTELLVKLVADSTVATALNTATTERLARMLERRDEQ